MPGFAPQYSIGAQPPTDLWVPDTVQKHPLGLVMTAYDPFFGWGEFVYGKSAAAQEAGSLVRLADSSFTMEDYPNTANLGQPFFVARANMSAADLYGWYQRSGLCALSVSVSVAEDVAIGVTGAGTAGTNSAGKQLLNTIVKQASTYNFTRTISTVSGSPIIKVSSVDGLVHNLTVTGTGIPASTEISGWNANNEVTLNQNATATGTVTGTFTFTGFVLAYIDRPFVQGAIT